MPLSYFSRSPSLLRCLWLTSVILGNPSWAAPAPPSGLEATTISSTETVLNWIGNAGDESGFRIERSPDNVTFSLVATIGANLQTYSSHGLDPATKYYYRVLAFDGTGDSDYTDTVSATTLTPYANWQWDNFTEVQRADPAVSGPTANPDGDAYDNQTEFTFFGDPLMEDHLDLISTANIAEDPDGLEDRLTISVRRNILALDISVGAEASGNLQQWSSGEDAVKGPEIMSQDAISITEKFRAVNVVGSSTSDFLRLRIEHTGVPDSWLTGPTMPVVLAEVGGAIIGNRLFLVGGRGNRNDPDPDTLAYNLETNMWDPLGTWADRTYQGNHHAVESFGGKLYVFGGFGVGSEGKLQIFDPNTNTWTMGTDVPSPVGSANSALIGNYIYLAGGEERPSGGSRSASTKCYRYDPSNDSWSSMASVPQGRHHSAGGTDGVKFYIFGGRISNARGYDEVQIYDPTTDMWVSSADEGSNLMPLPTARSGMGKTVYYKGEFYTFGGEDAFDTANTTPEQVYPNVEIYNPATNSWRTGKPMPTPRHGIFPILYRDRIYLPGGGPVISGGATGESDIMEIYIP